MAGNGDDGLGPFEAPSLMDNFDDVLYMLDGFDNFGDPPLPPPASDAPVGVQPADGSSGADPPTWPAMTDTYFAGYDAPGASRPTGLPDDAGPSTSAEAYALDCSGCQLLREIVHSKGHEASKLCVHGAAGVFYHATLDIYHLNPDGSPAGLTHQSAVDFSTQDYEGVRRYLTDYALGRSGGSFVLVDDSLSVFHDVLCTTMNHGGALGGTATNGGHQDQAVATNQGSDAGVAPAGGTARNGGDQPVALNHGSAAGGGAARNAGGGARGGAGRARRGGDQPAPQAAAVQQPPIQQGNVDAAPGPSNVPPRIRRVGTSRLARQKEKSKRLGRHDITPYFHLTINNAALELDVSPTLLKGVCRRVGIPRWPYRQVTQINKEIAKLQNSANGGQRARNALERQIARKRLIYDGPQ